MLLLHKVKKQYYHIPLFRVYVQTRKLQNMVNIYCQIKPKWSELIIRIVVGVITSNEVSALNDIDTPHGKWWVPIVWICNLVKQARSDGKIRDDYLMKTIIDVSKNKLVNLFLFVIQIFWNVVKCLCF